MTAAPPTLATITGIRQNITVILPATLHADPPWSQGPLPLGTAGAHTTDAAMRSTYFTPAAARALYGGGNGPRRWHLLTDASHGALHLDGVELLRTAADIPSQALAILHLTVIGPHLLQNLRALARRYASPDDPLQGTLDPALLFQDIATVAAGPGPIGPTRYTVAFLTPDRRHTPALRPTTSHGPGRVPPSADAWLWSLASRTNTADYPVAPEADEELRRPPMRISADWSAVVLRHGAAFLGHRPDTGPGDFYDFAQLHARTVYLDALLFGIVQRNRIDALTDTLSELFDGPGLARRVAVLETGIARFRSTYWRKHLTAHGPANALLRAYQDQHRLPERFEQILAETADFARLVQTQESQQINGALGVLTILGLPLGTALGILQVLGDQQPAHLLLALGLALATTIGAFTTRYGRLVLSSLRDTTRRR